MTVENNARLKLPTKALAQAVGPHLKQLVLGLRYDHYRDKDKEPYWDFVKKMGPDVVWLTHPDVMAQRMKEFIEHRRSEEDIGTEEEILLLTACDVHDLGELIIDGEGVGDVAGFLKGEEEAEMERDIFYKVMENVEESEEKKLLIKAYEEVELKRDSRLGRMLDTVEKIGYVENIIRVIQTNIEDRPVYWMLICGSVASSSVIELMDRRDEYGYVYEFLFSSMVDLDDIYYGLDAVDLVKLDDDKKEIFCDYREKFTQAVIEYGEYESEIYESMWLYDWNALKGFEEERL